MKKLLVMLLSAVMCLSVLASCTAADPDAESSASTEATTPVQTPGESSTPDNSAPEATTPEATPSATTTEEAGISVDMPLPVDLDRNMHVFIGKLHYEEWLDEDDGDIVNTELYHRVPRVEDNLGIELTFNQIGLGGGSRNEVYTEVIKYCDSTDPNMKADLCSTYSWWAGTLATEGRYLNIAASDNINFDMPYWPRDIIEGSSIDGKVYSVSGDISPTLLWETYCVFFNVNLLNKYNVEDPFTLVNNNEWTIDKLIEITSGIYSDDDTSVSGPNLGDTFAFTFSDSAHLKAVPFSAGLRVIELNDDNGYALSSLYTGEKAEALVTKISDWINNNNGVAVGGMIPGLGYGEAFIRNQAIFNLGNFAFTKYYLANTDVEFGVIPCPMYDDEQEQYYSYYGNPSAFWGIPHNVQSLDDSAALLESLAADAYINISPAIFERALKLKYNPADLNGQSHMFDIIRDGLVFDPCMLFKEKLPDYTEWREMTSTGSWSANFNVFKVKGWTNNIKSIVEKIRALPY